MKTSWVSVVLGALLMCGICFAQSNTEAQEYEPVVVTIPEKVLEINFKEEPLIKIIAEEQALANDVGVVKLPSPSGNQQSSEDVKVEQSSLMQPTVDLAEKDVNADNSSALQSRKFSQGTTFEGPSINKPTEELTTKNKEQVLPDPMENEQSFEEMSVKEPKVMKTSEEALPQVVEIKQANVSGAVETVIVKEPTDIPAKSNEQQSSTDMKVEDPLIEKTVEESVSKDEITSPHIFVEEQQKPPSTAENLQFNSDMKVLESAHKIKREEPALEVFADLPPVLEMIVQKPSKSVDPIKLIPQTVAMLDSEMRLPRQVQQEEHLSNNADKESDDSADIAEERAVLQRQVVRGSFNSNIVRRRKVNPAQRIQAQRIVPNNLNVPIRRRNVNTVQMIKRGQWVRNGLGQWVRKGQGINNRQWVRNGQGANKKQWVRNDQGVKNGQWVQRGQWIRWKTSNNNQQPVVWYNINTGKVKKLQKLN